MLLVATPAGLVAVSDRTVCGPLLVAAPGVVTLGVVEEVMARRMEPVPADGDVTSSAVSGSGPPER